MENNITNQNNTANTVNTGGIVVFVTAANETQPIAGAHVIITRRNGTEEDIIYTLTTNASGRTPTVTLPSPPKSYSMTPGRPLPYSNYNIRVDYPGYYTVENVNVPIFPGIIAVQPVNLVPLPLDTYSGKTKIFTESEPEDLYEEEDGGTR